MSLNKVVFAISLLRLNIFPWNFANLLPVHIHTHRHTHTLANFGQINLIFHRMALIFLGVLNRLQFRVSPSQIAVTSSRMVSGPIYSTLVHWIIRFGGNAEVLSQAAAEDRNNSRVLKCTSVDLVCLTGESHWQRYYRTTSMCHSVS